MASDISNELLDEINKRLTLNMLMQGVASHAMLTAHHLARRELAEIHPGLIDDYDRFVVSLFLGIWIGEMPLLVGRPQRFWSRTRRESHPFHHHRLLAQYGGELSQAFKMHLLGRAKEKRVQRVPVLHMAQQLSLSMRVAFRESGATERLEGIARQTTATIWSIDEDRLDGTIIAPPIKFGGIRTPVSRRGKIMKALANGWDRVVLRDGRMVVVAKAQFWPLLVHELVKGTAELICLHGLNTLSADDYERVLEATDHIEYESWHMQTGAELWRRLLALLPPEATLAETLMRMARLEPQPLEALMLTVVTEPDEARKILARL